jgi:ribosome biogenesis ATPase
VAQEEAIREQVIVNDSYNDGGLNASLRQRYKQVQQERQEKKKEETIVESPLPTVKAAKTTTTTTTTTASKGSTKKRKNGNKQRSDTFSPATAAAASSSSSLFPPGFLSPVTRPTERYSDLGGMDDIVVELKQLVEYPMIRPELYNHLGIDPPRGVLLRGPPGVGKSHLANAGECSKGE